MTLGYPTMLFLWLVLGVVYTMINWELNFVQGLYFSFFACTTGGLMGPDTTQQQQLETLIYILIGVPLYFVNLTNIAAVMGENAVDDRIELEKGKARAEAKNQTAAYVKNSASGTGRIDFVDFLQIQLLKMNKADQRWLDRQREEFITMAGDQKTILLSDVAKNDTVLKQQVSSYFNKRTVQA